MKKFYHLCSFIAALILTACVTTGTALNIKTILSQPDGDALMLFFALMIVLSAMLVKISFKELKQWTQ